MKHLICTTAVATLLALPAMAQQATTGTGAEQPPVTDQQTQMGQMEIEASGLIGKRLYIQHDGESAAMQTPQDMTMPERVTDPRDHWQTAGQINDLVLTEAGDIRALLIDSGGFLGFGQADRRIDIQNVRFVPHGEDAAEFFVVYTGDRQMLEAEERFDEAQLQDGEMRGTQTWGDEMRGSAASVAVTSVRAEELVGASVFGPGEEWVGDVSDLALTDDGEIEAVIVDVGGFLGLGTHTVALPMEDIELRRGDGGWFQNDLRAHVSATQDQLEAMPQWQPQ